MKNLISGIALLASFSTMAAECIDLSGRYLVSSPEDNCSVELLKGEKFDEWTVGYSPLLMGFAIDLQFTDGSVRAGNHRAFEIIQKGCEELTVHAWAYDQVSYTGGKVNLKNDTKWSK